MGNTSLLLGFIGVAGIAYLIPGPDWMMVMHGATDGVWNGVRTGLGSQAGLLVHGALATVGVSALIAAAPAALVTLQAIGAIYLIYLGAPAFELARREIQRPRSAGDKRSSPI